MRGIDVSKSKIRSERHCATNVACLLEEAETLGRQGRTTEARTAYTAAVGTDSGHVAQHAWACFLLKEGAIAEAVEQFVALFEIACHADNDDLRASASNNLACAYREWGRYEEAARWQQRSISFWSKIDTDTENDPPTADWSNLAIDAINRGDLDTAETLLQWSLQLECRENSLEGQASDWGNLGIVSFLSADYPLACTRLLKAYRLHRQLDDRRSQGCDLLHLAEVAWESGRDGMAIACLKRAVRVLQGVNAVESATIAGDRVSEMTAIHNARRRDPLLN